MKFPKLKSKFVLAPMEEVSDLPFRMLCRKYGAALCSSEQINAIGLIHGNKKALLRAKTSEDDTPFALQLSGSSKETILEAARKMKGYDILDINMGCPSKKVVKQGFGAALLKHKEKVKDMMDYLVKNIKVPVTVKMRSGFKKNDAVQIAKVLEKSGVAAITIHARTQNQKYEGAADWETIKNVKQAVKIPVIGNGDITSAEKAKQMLKETGCDYVMIGRAALKNPAIFKQCTDPEYKINKKEILETYIALCKKYKFPMNHLKTLATNLIKGERNSASVKNEISHAKSTEEILSLFNTFINTTASR